MSLKNKMEINKKNSEFEFKYHYKKEISEIAQMINIFNSPIDLSKYCLVKDDNFFLRQENDRLIFTYEDNSKPLHYLEVKYSEIDADVNDLILPSMDVKVVDKIFKDKYKSISFKYPYYNSTEPERMIAIKSENYFFGGVVTEYTKIKEFINIKPDFYKVEQIIYEALKIFHIIEI